MLPGTWCFLDLMNVQHSNVFEG